MPEVTGSGRGATAEVAAALHSYERRSTDRGPPRSRGGATWALRHAETASQLFADQRPAVADALAALTDERSVVVFDRGGFSAQTVRDEPNSEDGL